MAGIDKYIELDEDDVNSLVEDLSTEHQIEIAVNVIQNLEMNEMIQLLELVEMKYTILDKYELEDDLKAFIKKLEGLDD